MTRWLTLAFAMLIASVPVIATGEEITVAGLDFYAVAPATGRPDTGFLIVSDNGIPAMAFDLIAAPTNLPVRTDCSPCAGGSTVNPSGRFDLAGSSSSATLYRPADVGWMAAGSAYGVGTLSFVAQDIALPRLAPGERVLLAPLNASGSVRLYDQNTNELVFGTDAFSVGGEVSLSVIGGPQGYRFQQASYLTDASAVPEPSSLFLIGSGLVLGFGRKTRRR